jgi:hypothetical protein
MCFAIKELGGRNVMIRDILEEKWIRNVSYPVIFGMKIIIAIFILLFGWTFWPYLFAGYLGVISNYHAYPQIDYLLPVRDAERRKRIILKTVMESALSIILLGAGVYIPTILYHAELNCNVILVVLIHICAFFIFVDVKLGGEIVGLQGHKRKAYTWWNVVRSAVVICIVWFTFAASSSFCAGSAFSFLGKKQNNLWHFTAIILILGSILVMIDIWIRIKKLQVEDYHDNEILTIRKQKVSH